MWTCPKCGRTFKRQEQEHFCGKAPETIEDMRRGTIRKSQVF